MSESRFEMVENGVGALMKMPVFRPKVLLVDLIIPEMDGWRFIEAVREERTTTACSSSCSRGWRIWSGCGAPRRSGFRT
jgi:CheY-like chemotaxis protein